MKHLLCAFMLCGLIQSTSFAQDWKPNPKVIAANQQRAQRTERTDTATSFQCWGTTQKGLRCKHKVKTAGGYCYQHQSQAK